MKRIVAAVTAFAFLSLQLLAPLARAEENPLPTWLREDRGGWVPAEQAQRMRRADQDLLAHLSMLEQAQQRFITTHPSGLEAQYANQELVVARDSAGNLLWSPTFDDYRKVQNGTLLLVDGTLQVVKNGQLVRQVDAMGNEAVFRTDGRVDFEIAADGTRTDYAYSETGFTRTIHNPNGDLVQEYNAEGRLVRETTPEGKVSTYSNGILSTVSTGGFSYTYSSETAADGTITATLSEARGADGAIYTLANGELATIRWADGTVYTIAAGTVRDVLLPDGRVFRYDTGWLRQLQTGSVVSAYSYTFDAGGNLRSITVTVADGSSRVYSAAGTLQGITDPNGTRWTVVNGLITQSISPTGVLTTYTRTSSPLGQQIQRATGGSTDRFSFDPQGRLYAAGSDRNVTVDPFSVSLQTITLAPAAAAGVVATDGSYLYVKPGSGTSTSFRKIGTGLNGTVAGRSYGTLSGAVGGGISATFASDGFLYQPDPTNLRRVERINPDTGARSFIALPTAFLTRQTAASSGVLITSDGRYVYNLSSQQSRNATAYNGWTVRVYDPQNGWAMVREFTAGATSYSPAGFFADGIFLYILEGKTSGTAKFTTIRVTDGAVVRSSTTPASRKLLNGQYDWRNQRIWVGTSTGGKIHAQDGPNDLPISAWVDREGLRMPIPQTQLPDMNRLRRPDNAASTDLQTRIARDLPGVRLSYSGLPAGPKVARPNGLWNQASWAITPDTLPPTGAMETPALTNQREITLTLSALDPAAADGTTGSGVRTMRFSMDGGRSWRDPEPVSGTKTVTLPHPDGTYSLLVQFQDRAGNGSNSISRAVTLDTIPPAVLLQSPALTNKPAYTLTYAIDGAVQSETLTLAEGANTITRAATDPVGNTSTANWTITLDTAPPALALGSPAETDSELYSAVIVTDGENQPAQTWRLGRGTHQLIAEATDTAGNSARARLAVTRTGSLPEPVDPPILPESQRLTQTLADGSVATYRDGKLVLVTTADGTRLISPTLDAEGRITGGWLTTPDGTTTFLQGGAAVWSKTPLGAVYWYSPGQWVEAVRGLDGTLTSYAYRLNAAGEVTAILVSTTQESLLLDPDGTEEPGSPQAAFALLQNAQGGITGLSAERDGVTRSYNAAGQLNTITLADQTQLTFDGENLAGVRLADGTRISDGVYDADSKLISGTVTLPDGRIVRYTGGQPIEATLPDGSKVSYTAGRPSGLTMPAGNSYTLTLRPFDELRTQGDREATWEAVRPEPEQSRRIEGQSDSLTRLTYSPDWALLKADRGDGARLAYTNGRLSTLTQANGIVISYAYDSEITSGAASSSRSHDTAGRLSSTVAASPDPAEPAIRSEYAYDRIRRVFKGSDPAGSDPNGVLLYEYSYEFEPSGAETTVIHEISTGLTKRYRGGLLLSQTDPDGAVTTYEYTADPAGYTDPLETAVGAVRELPDGTKAHYVPVGTGPARSWKLAKFTWPDGTELTSGGQQVDPLTDNNTVTQATGKVGNAAQFNRANSEYLSSADNADLSMGDIDFTLAAWVYIDSIGSNSIIGKGVGGANNLIAYNIYYSGGTFRFLVGDGVSNHAQVLSSTAPIGSFYYVVAWHDSVANTINIQINNGTVASVSYSAGSHDDTRLFTLGAIDNNPVVYDFMNGRIDEVGIWKKALSAQERADLYNAGAGNTFRQDRYAFNVDSAGSLPDGLVAYYNLDERSGPRADAADLSALFAQAALPADPAALRRMVEQKTLQLIQPDATDRALQTAVGAVRELPDGTKAHYVPVGTGPAHSWKLAKFTWPDGTELTNPSNLGGTPLPLTANNNPGNAPGIRGNAAVLIRGNQQSLSIADTPDLSMGNDDFTIAAWVYLNSTAAAGYNSAIVDKWGGIGRGVEVEYGIFEIRNGPFAFNVGNGTGAVGLAANSFGRPALHQWHFIVAWHDSVNDTVNISVNNGTVDTKSYAGGSWDGNGTLYLGSRHSGAAHLLDGRIDEVGIWKKALSTQERATLYNGGAGNTFRQDRYAFDVDSTGSLADRLVAYYNLDEPSGRRSDSANLSSLMAQAGLPDDPAGLKRLVENGTLKLIQPAAAAASVRAERVEAQSPVLARATVTYQGKPRESFTYTYGSSNGSGSHDLTYVTDSAGVTRAYDATKRLVRIEQPDGTRYDVTHTRDLSAQQSEQLQANRRRTLVYTDLNGRQQTLDLPDPDLAPFEERTGEEITIQSLSRRLLKDGTELLYQFGRLHKIRLPDGRALTDFTVDRNGIPLRATLTLPDGTTKPLQNGALVEVTRPGDNVKLRYRNDRIAEIHVPINILRDVTVSNVGLDAQGRLQSGEVLLPSGDRLTLSGGRFSGARLDDGTEVRSVVVNQDKVTGAVLSVSGSSATLSNSRDVGVTLSSGQEYRYRYKLDSAGRPTNELETMTFRDDFEDGNSLGWRTTGDWSVTGGALRGSSMNKQLIYAQTGLNWTNYTVSTSYTFDQAAGHGTHGGRLLFRYQDDNNYYELIVERRTSDPRQGWWAGFVGKTSGQHFQKMYFPLSWFRDGTPQSHTLRVDVSGSTFQFYVDGNHLGSASDTRLSSGSVGLAVNYGIYRYHDIEVTFPGEDLRDPATRDVDAKLRSLREAVAQASGPIAQIGIVPSAFNPAAHDPARVRILEVSTDPDVRSAISAVVQAASDPNLAVITEMDSKERPLAITKIDGSTTTFNEFGNALAQYNQDGRRQVTYSYDSKGHLVKTTLEADRADLSEQMDVLSQEITRRRAQASRALAEQAGVINQETEIQIQVAREQLANQKTTLEGQLHSMESTGVSGKSAKSQKGATLDQIRGGIGQIRDAQDQLERQYVEVLSNLRAEIASANRQIEEQTASAFAEIQTQKGMFLKGILRQEILPIVGEVYRLTIGRDPNSESEVRALVDELYIQFGGDPTASVNRDLLEQRIRALPDYQDRVTQVAAIKQQVTAWLTRYAQSPSARAELVEALGLSPDEVVPLSQSDVDRILDWLNSGNLHFGHSAFLALKEFLAAQGIEAEATLLAIQAIQIDILVGVLNPKTTGDLQLSLFSLQRVARLHGGSATPVQVSFNDLKALLAAGPAIAHVNGNHYFLVLSIAADGTVTYREPNQGPTGETLTMTQAEFLQVWKGVLLSPRAPPQAYQVLTDREAQAITGSLWPLIAFILFVISTGLQFVQNETVQLIGRIIGYIAIAISVFTLAFQLASSVTMAGIKTAFSGFSQGFVSGIQVLGQSVWQGVTAIAKTLFNPSKLITAFKAAAPVAGEAAKATLPQLIATTVFTTGVNIGVSKGLDALGVDPAISSLAGALVSGGITGGLGHSSTQTFWGGALTGSLTSTAIAGTQLGLAKAGVDSSLAGIAGIGIGAITHSMLTSGISGLGGMFQTQLYPTLAGELAFYNIQKLGETIGLDPRISQLAGMPIKTGIGNITRPGHTSQSVIQAMGKGLLSGATQIGLDYGFESAGIEAWQGALMSRVVTSAIEGIWTGTPLKGLEDSAMNFLTMNLANKSFVELSPWDRAVYLSKVNDFSQIVRDQGIGKALETYAASIFSRDAVESIWKLGGIFDLMAGNAEVTTNENLEKIVRRVYTNRERTNYFDLSLQNDELLAIKQGNVYMNSKWYIGPDGAAVHKEGRRITTFKDGSKMVEVISDFNTVYAELVDKDGKTVKVVRRAKDSGPILMREGKVWRGQEVYSQEGYRITWDNGEPVEVYIPLGAEADLQGLKEYGLPDTVSKNLPGLALTLTRQPDGSYKANINQSANFQEKVREFSVPIHTDPAYDGWEYRSITDMSPKEAARSLQGFFQDLKGFNPANSGIGEKSMDTLKRLAVELIAFGSGKAAGGTLSESNAPEWLRQLTDTVTSQATKNALKGSDVKLLTRERIDAVEIARKIDGEFSYAGTIIDRASVAYDHVTVNDADKLKETGWSVLVGMGFKRLGPLGTFLSAITKIPKFQPTDPTQTRYSYDIDYRVDNPLYFAPYRKMKIEFTVGQYVTSTGESGYGVIEATLTIKESDPLGAIWEDQPPVYSKRFP